MEQRCRCNIAAGCTLHRGARAWLRRLAAYFRIHTRKDIWFLCSPVLSVCYARDWQTRNKRKLLFISFLPRNWKLIVPEAEEAFAFTFRLNLSQWKLS